MPAAAEATATAPDHYASTAGRFGPALYGTIITTALLATQRHGGEPDEVVVTLLMTGVVLWLAHAWTEIVVARVEHGERFHRAHIGEVLHEELPLVVASMVPAVIVATAWIGWVEADLAIDVAIGVGIAMLAGWGMLAARRSSPSWSRAVLVGVVDAALGVVIVVLEAAVLH